MVVSIRHNYLIDSSYVSVVAMLSSIVTKSKKTSMIALLLIHKEYYNLNNLLHVAVSLCGMQNMCLPARKLTHIRYMNIFILIFRNM